MKKLNLLFTAAFVLFALALTAQPGDTPPNAEPGKCYAKCIIPDEYETVTERIETKAATTRNEVIPAVYETVTERVMKSGEATRLIPVPAEYETVTERVLVKEESKRIEVIPAVYETVTERVLDKAEATRLVAVPAEYETVTETYQIEPEGKRIETLAPKYETMTERLETSPATTKWVKRQADRNCLSADPNDCLVWCLVEVPAQYRTVTKRVNVGCDGSGVANAGCVREVVIPAKMGTRTVRRVVKPATTTQVAIPAEYKTITKRVLKTPATTREVVIPAEYTNVTRKVVKTPATTRTEAIPAQYETISKRVLKSPASTRTIDIPAEYTTVTKRNLVKQGGFTEWREVLCGNKVTDYTVRQIQAALRERGYDPGPTDNILGTRTKAALVKFQKDKGLPQGSLDFETLKALGVKY